MNYEDINWYSARVEPDTRRIGFTKHEGGSVWFDYEEFYDFVKGAGTAFVPAPAVDVAFRIINGSNRRSSRSVTPFGQFVNRDRSSVTFKKDGETVVISTEMVVELLNALEVGGVIDQTRKRLTLHAFSGLEPELPTPEKALDIIRESITKSADSYASAGQWLAKFTNMIADVTREDDSGD